MKTPITCVLAFCFASSLHAEMRTWTRSDGKTAELELLSVAEQDGEKVGEFKMANGKTASIKASALAEADAKILAEWKPPVVAGVSVFDEILKGNLEKLDDDKLKPFNGLKKPLKYYMFYYTASWCGPCQKYTPQLVEFYNKNKNDNFEIILVTSDRDARSMEEYAKAKKMPWPHLDLKSARTFVKTYNHGVSGIPSLITCDLQGNIVSRTEAISELEKLVK